MYYIEGSDDLPSIDLTVSTLSNTTFWIPPEKEDYVFMGWYLNDFTLQVSDRNGNPMISVEQLFSLPPESFLMYPKWVPLEHTYYTYTPFTADTCSVCLINKELITATIPSQVFIDGKEYTVTEIALGGFMGSLVKQVYLPSSVKVIGQGAFANCTFLEIISMPAVESIVVNAFVNCLSLSDLVIPKTVTIIGQTILRYCNTKVHIRPNTDTSAWHEDWNLDNENQDVEYNSDFEFPTQEPGQVLAPIQALIINSRHSQLGVY